MAAAEAPILFISNGMGEDSIAAEIIKRLPKGLEVDAYPIIGGGRAFEGVCQIVGPRSHIPSQGARLERLSLLSDLPSMLASIAPAVRFLRQARIRYRKIFVVGDSVGIVLARLAGIRINLYLDVYKVGQAHRYSSCERAAIGRTVDLTLCRDEILVSQLRRAGINARSHGNIMLDTISYGSADLSYLGKGRPVVGLLPGSRSTAPSAFALQAEALHLAASEETFDAVLALAPDIEPTDLAAVSQLQWEAPELVGGSDCGRLVRNGLNIVLVRGATGNVIEASHLLLSQSGTATQQALGLGRPVIAYHPEGHRAKRLKDEQALMGVSRILVPPRADDLARALVRLLRDPSERERLGRVGRTRMGGAGTMAAVLEELAGKSR